MPQPAQPGLSLGRELAVVAAVGAGTFVFAFQVAALFVALPAMAGFLRPPFSADWAVTIYLLFLSGLLLLFGSFGDQLGTKRFYIAGLVAFTAASFLCAIAKAPSLFLIGRALQGIGAALSAANSPAILTRNLFPERRGRALGWQAAMTYLGLAAGPSIGAVTLAHFAWRAIFLLEIPAGMIAICLGVYAIPPEVRRTTVKLNGRASEVFWWISCLAPLLFALSGGARWGWNSPKVAGLLLVSLVAFVSFLGAERRNPGSLVDLRLFDTRGFSIAVVGEFLFYLALYGLGFLVPILIVRGRGMAPGWAGMLLTTQSITRMVIAPISGIAADRLGTRGVLCAGVLLFSIGILAVVCMSNAGSILTLSIALAFVGLGTGIFVPANSSRLLSYAPVQHHGMASGLLATARNLGMMLGVAVAAAAYSSSLPTHGVESVLSGIRRGLSIVLFAASATMLASWIPDNDIQPRQLKESMLR